MAQPIMTEAHHSSLPMRLLTLFFGLAVAASLAFATMLALLFDSFHIDGGVPTIPIIYLAVLCVASALFGRLFPTRWYLSLVIGLGSLFGARIIWDSGHGLLARILLSGGFVALSEALAVSVGYKAMQKRKTRSTQGNPLP